MQGEGNLPSFSAAPLVCEESPLFEGEKHWEKKRKITFSPPVWRENIWKISRVDFPV
jgi:hypothetical protein